MRQKNTPDARDVTGLVGLVLLGVGAAGCWGWSVAAMVVGALLFVLAVAGAARP